MPHEIFKGLEKGKLINGVRAHTGANVTDFKLHEAEAPAVDHPIAKNGNEAYVVTEPSMEHLVGAIALRNIEDGTAEVAIETPDGQTMEASLIRSVVPAAMEASGVIAATLDTTPTNVPIEKLERSGFSQQDNGDHTLHIR